MLYPRFSSTTAWPIVAAIVSLFIFTACSDDSMPMGPGTDDPSSASFTYAFNEGQLLSDVNTAYRGAHDRTLNARIDVDEMEDGNAAITVTLENTLDGERYSVHAHDAADPETTPNNTPYNETPNADVFAQLIDGTGGSASATNETSIPFAEITEAYEGFFVVHDPLQELTTVDLTTYLILGSFGESLDAGASSLRSASFDYAFNEGQLLGDPDTAYEAGGDHPRSLSAVLDIEERSTGAATVTVTLENTLDGEAYSVHAHDMADPAETPNGTPYNETPNGDVFARVITGTGGAASASFESEMLYTELVETYEAFLVVHDPTQAVTTVDLTTYLVLGVFGQSLEAGDPNLREVTLTLGNDGASAYFATSVDGADAGEVVALNENNASITLEKGTRYTVAIESGGSHPFGLDDGAGTVLLNHDGTGAFAEDPAVDLATDGNGGLSFTLTTSLAQEIAEYFCNFHGSMRGAINVVE